MCVSYNNIRDTALRWLAKSFGKLGNRKSFGLGDGLPIGSDGNPDYRRQKGAAVRLSTLDKMTDKDHGRRRRIKPRRHVNDGEPG
jgi:hypothetical protein